MKYFLLILLSVLCSSTSMTAQVNEVTINQRILEAVLKGDSKAFKSMLDGSAKYQRNSTLIINSPLQITFQMKKFFESYPCASARIVSQGGWSNFAYMKMDYRSANQRHFTFFFFFEDENITKIQIDGN